MNHGELNIKGAAEWGDNDSNKNGAESKSVFYAKLWAPAQDDASGKI